MTKALIIGGGIAGAVTAMALHKAGVEAVVYEAYPSGADDIGAFLTVAPNGMAALKAIDADQVVAEAAFPATGMEVLNGSGTVLGRVTMDGGPRTIKRARLYRVLHDEATRREITIEHGKRLTSAETTPDGRVLAEFADGTRADADLLVGADGIHSTTRFVIDAAAPRPSFTGLVNVYGYTREPAAAAEPDSYRMIYGNEAFFGCTTAPDGETWWFANLPIPELSRAEIAAMTPARWRDRAAGFFTGDRTPASRVITSTGEEIFGSNGYEIPTVPVWHTDSIVLVGDAAHAASPSSAQGASMAIEDAVVLAKCLRDLPDPPSAFRAFDRLRRQRVEAIVAMGARSNNRKMPGPREREARDRMLIERLSRPAPAASDQVREYRIEWDQPVHVS